jgi:cytidylate kinase
MEAPNVIVLAGPNGAGKSTISNSLIREQFGLAHYVNADTIARGLSAFNVEAMAIKAGRIMLQHLHELAAAKEHFAFDREWRREDMAFQMTPFDADISVVWRTFFVVWRTFFDFTDRWRTLGCSSITQNWTTLD